MAEKKYTRSTTKSEDRDIGFKEVQEMLFSDTFMNRFCDMISTRINGNLETLIDNLNTKLSNAEVKINALEEQNRNFCKRLDQMEQYSRRNNLRIFGLPEVRGENTDIVIAEFFHNKLSLTLPTTAIDRSHRIGKEGKGPRAVIVKFCSYRDRQLVFLRKKQLKGTSFVITEDLTVQRLLLKRKAIEKFGSRNVWTTDGRVTIKIGEKIQKVEEEAELLMLNKF